MHGSVDLIIQCVGSLHVDLFVEQHVGSLCVCMGNKTTHIYHTYIIRSHCGFKNSTCIFGEIAVLTSAFHSLLPAVVAT